ncbi:MAG: SDR family oxidoreductase [Ignavibacterium sp.]|jgi:NAD(P)-dependent dehydrogenase (short-subunit alcohol dehydrogenase family)|nr:SDR family oxidoreductase [Ignavibacterium sp.]MDX9712196.1 SDR family oxidoreductase [Ignavibacteriaceae bacterium]GIK22255.1 MAG: short-chain dehydrogenase [Ignavibacteriota bacterium]HMN18397.1 SDR family oxidoreductase [Ignavibacteriaceae bacterium]
MPENNYTTSMLKSDALKDKVILITGGGTGLGKSMGKYFSELGAKLIISSRKIDVLNKTAEEISSLTKNDVFPFACDVSDYKQVEVLLKASLEKFGRVDALVNNAAGNFISPTEKLSNRAFDAIVNIVLKGTYNCTLAFGKHWIENKNKAVVLNIVTTYAWTGSAFVVPSAAAKAGVLAITRSLAVEWAKYGIRFNAIAPGLFPTKGAWERLLPGDLQEKLDAIKKIPLKRVGEHQELANLAAYLISDFSSFINGEVITIDGGEWLNGAGQFNLLQAVSSGQWDDIEKMVRGVKGS